MRVVLDIEANGLENPTKIWLVVCKDIDTNKFHIFRKISDDEEERNKFLAFAKGVDLWIGHNWLGYDYPVLNSLLGWTVKDVVVHSCDTLIISKLVDYPRKGHSVEDYGEEFGLPKGFEVEDGSTLESKHFPIWFYQSYSKDLENYCIRDVDITHKIYEKYKRYINDPKRRNAIKLEHSFQLVSNDLHNNGFAFNKEHAQELLGRVNKDLNGLDESILKAFPPREVLVREFTPKATKFGTISKTSVPRLLHDQIHTYEVGKTYKQTKLVDFNPSSHKQIIQVLSEAGWTPTDKTTTHIQFERNHRVKGKRSLDLSNQEDYDRYQELQKYGFKINENNLATLPDEAPTPARLLAKRILLESRRRTLTEWLGLVKEDNRIHGKFYSIGAWTHRMAHQNPNTANIPTDAKLYGHEMRALWRAPRNRLLVGVDAEGIQLRIFAHYINDPEFTDALVRGKKEDKSDPHSLNQRILKAPSRNHAKRFIFAYLLGGGIDKLSQILEMSREEGEAALQRLVERYSGLGTLKQSVIPADAKRGWFLGLDGRAVRIPGETLRDRSHLCMSGYLQNGEAVVMKKATVKWYGKLDDLKTEHPRLNWKLVNLVHDEWQTEVNNSIDLAKIVAQCQADALREVGEELKLNCPLAGSYWSDDAKDFTIGCTWAQTH